MFLTFTLCDDLETQDAGAIEVVLHMPDGTQRWCYFMTPIALAACGDRIGDGETRIHYGAPNMIVVSERLTEATIELALQHIARAGEIETCSRLIE